MTVATPSKAEHPRLPLGLALKVFLPFAIGYFLSYLFRSVNAVISPDLVNALGLSATDLGLLTSVYFLTFAIFQIPLGILLDRFGPRRAEASLLLFAAAGSAVFSLSAGLEGLIIGRALIGLGVSACLMGAFKAFISWHSVERLPAINGAVLASGGLGALVSTIPVEAALQFTDWRGLFMGLSLLSVGAAAGIFFVFPERGGHVAAGGLRDQLREVASIFRSRNFWNIAPLSMLSQATFMAIQGLWAGPWLQDIAGLDRSEIANHLFFTAAAMVAGHLGIGNLASRLARSGIRPIVLAKAGIFIFILVQLAIAYGITLATLPLWMLFGFFGTAGSLGYSILSQSFPPALSGRVNTALNLLVFVFAFAAQWGIGALINLWPLEAAGYSLEGYRIAFGVPVAFQIAAFTWLWLAARRRDQRGLKE